MVFEDDTNHRKEEGKRLPKEKSRDVSKESKSRRSESEDDRPRKKSIQQNKGKCKSSFNFVKYFVFSSSYEME